MSRRESLRVIALLEAASITGTAKAVYEMALEAWAAKGEDRSVEMTVAIFSRGEGVPDNVLTRTLSAAGIEYSFIRESGRFDSGVVPQIRSLADKYGAQVVWTNSVKSHFLVNQAAVQKTAKWVAFHHGYTSTDFKMRLYNELDRLSLRNADMVLTVCEPFARQMEARGVDRERIRVQHMPIRPFENSTAAGAQLRNELGLAPDEDVVLSIGRLSHEKGHLDLVKAFAQLCTKGTRAKLVLVGDGPERAGLEQAARQAGIAGKVVFAGHRDDAKNFYGVAKVFALPSFTEGTPNVLLEAMAAGVTVVATAVGGVPELASNDKNALLIPARDPAALTEALQRVLGSAELRERLTQAAQEVVASHAPRLYYERMRDLFFETCWDVGPNMTARNMSGSGERGAGTLTNMEEKRPGR